MSSAEMSPYHPYGRGYSQYAHRRSARATPVIGLVGGVGPYAGLDLQRKILEQTLAARDQEYLPVISVSWPSPIPDRTEFLLGHVTENPAYPILDQLRLLSESGAAVAGIPCNTAHAPSVFDVIRVGVAAFERPLRLLHMIEETVAHLESHHPMLRMIGVLSTTGTWRARLYPAALEPLGYHVIAPEEGLQVNVIHPAVYDTEYGIKSTGRVAARARANLERGIDYLREAGAEAIILGCTEMPLAFAQREYGGVPLIDPTLILARALIRAADPQRLRTW